MAAAVVILVVVRDLLMAVAVVILVVVRDLLMVALLYINYK
jgi:hypothetical protein